MRKYLKTGILCVSAVILSTLMFSGCSKRVIKDENVLRLPLPTDIKGFDPVYAEDLYSSTTMSQIYETLFQYSYLERPYKIEPCLLDGKYDVSPDGLVYTFRIKKGVLFQDDRCFAKNKGKGRELVAEDFVYSFKRIADIKNSSTGWWIFDNRIAGLNKFREKSKDKADYSEDVEGLRAIDRYTLKIKLTNPFPQFLYVLAMTYSAAVPMEAVEYYGKEFINHPVGTGPYRLAGWTRNSLIVFEKNPSFRKEFYPSRGEKGDHELGLLDDAGRQMPFIDRVEFQVFLEDQPQWLNFLKGNIDRSGIPKDNFNSAITPAKELIPKLEKKGVKLWKVPMLDVTYTGFNMEDPILGKNSKLRKAMSLAHNVNRVIDLFYNGRAIPAQTPIPPGLDGYDPDFRNLYCDFNLRLARQYLEEAGYPEGKGLPAFTFEVSGTGTTERQMSELFKREMQEIGITININYNTWPEFLKKMNTHRAQIFGLAWAADYPDAENFLQLFYGPNSAPGPNNTNFNEPEFNKLYEKISTMNPGTERTALYRRMQIIIVEECPWILGAHRLSYALNHQWLKNYKPNDIASGLIKYYRIDSKERVKLIKDKF